MFAQPRPILPGAGDAIADAEAAAAVAAASNNESGMCIKCTGQTHFLQMNPKIVVYFYNMADKLICLQRFNPS